MEIYFCSVTNFIIKLDECVNVRMFECAAEADGQEFAKRRGLERQLNVSEFAFGLPFPVSAITANRFEPNQTLDVCVVYIKQLY